MLNVLSEKNTTYVYSSNILLQSAHDQTNHQDILRYVSIK